MGAITILFFNANVPTVVGSNRLIVEFIFVKGFEGTGTEAQSVKLIRGESPLCL
jgi:hypothetical protein